MVLPNVVRAVSRPNRGSFRIFLLPLFAACTADARPLRRRPDARTSLERAVMAPQREQRSSSERRRRHRRSNLDVDELDFFFASRGRFVSNSFAAATAAA